MAIFQLRDLQQNYRKRIQLTLYRIAGANREPSLGARPKDVLQNNLK